MKHVTIVIETSREYGRGSLRGIARFDELEQITAVESNLSASE